MKLKNFLLLGTLLIITSCASNDLDDYEYGYENNYENAQLPSLLDFIATAPNRTFILETTDEMPFHFAEETFNTIFIEEENLIQQKLYSVGVSSSIVLLHDEGVLRQIYSNFSVSPFLDLRHEDPISDIAILVEPLELGTGWQTPDGTISEITAVGIEVVTPYTTFTDTLEITRTFPPESGETEGTVVTSVFARGYGRIFESFPANINGEEIYIVRHLTRVIDGPLTAVISVFDDELEETHIPVSIYTNQNFEELFSGVLGFTVNEIAMRSPGTLQIDIDEGDHNLTAIAYTFMDFYDVLNVQIYINGSFVEEINW